MDSVCVCTDQYVENLSVFKSLFYGDLKIGLPCKEHTPDSVSKEEEEEQRRSPGVCQQFTVMKEGDGRLFTELKMWQTAQAILLINALGDSTPHWAPLAHVRWAVFAVFADWKIGTALFTLAAFLGQCALNPVNVFHAHHLKKKKMMPAGISSKITA